MNDSFVTEIDTIKANLIKEYLSSQGYLFSTIPYAIFSAKKEGVSLTLYQSGKLVIQGKNKDELIKYYIEPEILGSLIYSYPEALIDKTPRIGIDEAGKGDFFGPLCIAGVFADGDGIDFLLKNGVKDSKKLADSQIKKIAKLIKAKLPHECIILYPRKYNELYAKFNNLNSLLGWGHATTIEALSKKTGCKKANIDQFAGKHVVERALHQKHLDIDLSQNHKGESDPVIAAASILARDAFVSGIEKLSQEYGLTLPKGASKEVILAGKKFLATFGEEKLPLVAKTHFKTKQEL
ncbi:MAG: ribonuclease HIII [Chlamydiae bacterium]|nr:ribonuclease HIII [Chlamydiota bacterium]